MSKLRDINKKIEDAAVDSYKQIEKTVVEGYKKVEDKFVEKFLAEDGENTEQAKARLRAKQEELLSKDLER